MSSGIKGRENTPSTMWGSLFSPPNTADLIQNFRVHELGGWSNDRGIEGLLTSSNIQTPYVRSAATQLDIFSPTYFTQIWKRREGETYYLHERSGSLRYEMGALGNSGSQDFTIATGRSQPRANDAGPFSVSWGTSLIIFNGVDRPLKFDGDLRTRSWGWDSIPPSLSILSPYPLYAMTGSTSVNPPVGSSALPMPSTEPIGLGLSGSFGTRNINTYGYKVSFVSDGGGESPTSSPTIVTWQTLNAAQATRWAPVIDDIPLGSAGTVSRKIYRTRNMESGFIGSGEVYYLVKEIKDNATKMWVDIIPDDALVTEMDEGASIPIDSSWKAACAWDSRMWLGGGVSHPTKIIFSEVGLQDQFRRESYFNLDGKEGEITALFPYYGNILVFREKCIDMISKSGDSYRVSRLSSDVGTRSPKTIKNVPGLGVTFLSHDGVYTLRGGLDGGSVIAIDKMGGSLSEEWMKINRAALPRAWAEWSPKESEYWVHYPWGSSPWPTRGSVWHAGTKGWSLRNSGSYGLALASACADDDGWLVLGSAPNYNSNVASSSGEPFLGLGVWSATGSWGSTLWNGTYSAQSGNWTWSARRGTRPTSTITSPWESLVSDDGIVAAAKSVELDIVTTGDSRIELSWAVDWNATWTSAGEKTATRWETSGSRDATGTTAAEKVWATEWITGTLAPHRNNAIVGESRWEDHRVTRLRWDIPPIKSTYFRFKIDTDDKVHILSWNIVRSPTTYRSPKQQ